MSCYIIGYDLRNQRDYEALYDAIKSYGTYAHVLESMWVVVTSDNAQQIRDFLKQNVDSDDGLFVIKSAREAAWQMVQCSDQWLKDYL